MGESGIGKSEAALELIHRGHRLYPMMLLKYVKSVTTPFWEHLQILQDILSNFVVSVLLM